MIPIQMNNETRSQYSKYILLISILLFSSSLIILYTFTNRTNSNVRDDLFTTIFKPLFIFWDVFYVFQGIAAFVWSRYGYFFQAVDIPSLPFAHIDPISHLKQYCCARKLTYPYNFSNEVRLTTFITAPPEPFRFEFRQRLLINHRISQEKTVPDFSVYASAEHTRDC